MKMEIVFIGKPRWEGGWPYVGYDNEPIKIQILEFVNQNFPDIECNPNEMVTTYNEQIVSKIKENISNSDGLLIYTIGHYGDPGLIQAGVEFIELNKPTILANFVYAGDHTFTKIFATIKDKGYPIYPISSKNIEDVKKPIEILHKLNQIKGERILIYASDTSDMNWEMVLGLFDPERQTIYKERPEFIDQIGKMRKEKFEFYTDLVGLDQAHQWRKDPKKYNEILKNIFGVEMLVEDAKEIVEYYKKIESDEEAQKIAEKWVKNANKVEPSEKTILNAAKLYLALKNILKDKGVRFITPDCGTLLLIGMMPAFPCLPFFELSNEGLYGTCESDMDCMISNIFGLCITDRPGYVSNHTFDLANNQITYMHCVAPNKLYGVDGPAANYEIWYHGESNFLGASPCVKFPVGEHATTIKISVFEKKIAIRLGKIVNNVEDKKGCVSKMLVEDDVNAILENYDWETFGWHRVTFIGDWKEDFVIAAKLLGLEIVEEDKK